MRAPARSSMIEPMFIHPDIHREIARQRHQDLLVDADRRPLAKASPRAEGRLAGTAEQRERLATQRDADGVLREEAQVTGAAHHFGHREAGGVVVDLFWDRGNLESEFRIEVEDRRNGARFVLYPQTGRDAIQAFRHPFGAAKAALNGKAWAA
jgi:hypothetical protein